MGLVLFSAKCVGFEPFYKVGPVKYIRFKPSIKLNS